MSFRAAGEESRTALRCMARTALRPDCAMAPTKSAKTPPETIDTRVALGVLVISIIMKKNSTSTPPHGLRMTRQRRAILEALAGTDAHPTADQVYAMVRRRLPRISLGTVYRNLDLLSQAGLVRDLRLGGGPRRFDGITDPHYHVRCVRCGQVADVPVKTAPALERAAARSSGFAILGHRLEFTGICPRCASGAPRSRTKSRPPGRKGR